MIAKGQERWSKGRKAGRFVKKRNRKCGLLTEKQACEPNGRKSGTQEEQLVD
jgi:hypothetical protein